MEQLKTYPNVDYGAWFIEWLWNPEQKPYGRWGNGSAGWFFHDLDAGLRMVKLSSKVSYDH